MVEVHLRPINQDNFMDCLRLEVEATQAAFVASNAQSLAEAYVNPNLTPLGVYDVAARGFEHSPPVPMVGFTMYEVAAGVGFILRLMVDKQYQGRGYGGATMREVIRRLRLLPQVEIVATSHRHDNQAAAALYKGLGFVAWDIAYAQSHETETFLRLP